MSNFLKLAERRKFSEVNTLLSYWTIRMFGEPEKEYFECKHNSTAIFYINKINEFLLRIYLVPRLILYIFNIGEKGGFSANTFN